LDDKVDYGDVRLINSNSEHIALRNGNVEGAKIGESKGYGIRVIKDGAWGFAASNNFSKESIEETVKKAIEVARASAKTIKEKIQLDKSKLQKESYKTKVIKDPFSVSIEDKVKILLECDKKMRTDPRIVVAEGFMRALFTKKLFASTEGAFIEQELTETGTGIFATASDNKDVQIRSYPNSHEGQLEATGFEMVHEQKLEENAPRIAEEAIKLLSAKQCPTGKKDIIIDGTQLVLQVHESCGHPVELDRVFGTEASYAGTSFLNTEKLGEFRYGSNVVNITADATIPGALGSFGFDDEGIPAQRQEIIKNGIFVGYLTSRETAPRIGQKSNGTMRADGWYNIPLIRMTNINLEPGEWDLEDLIADTKDGVFLSTNKEWSIDDKRLNFQFGCEIAWEIKNGKLGQILKNPVYTGITPEFWNSCDAVCNEKYWNVWGVPNCGKGEPTQLAHVAHGTAPARFRKVKLGAGKW
ncbi:MAG: peptidase C69, partial [Flavobacterium sp.]|nr:peptidase C69 [Flavobacterium sp.]